ncbi:MAG TPA: hypothetical protein VL400_20345, partial [Polyangiaceae bacterium]|nr:hypothetical protein [Polyangiaceae bacterium]
MLGATRRRTGGAGWICLAFACGASAATGACASVRAEAPEAISRIPVYVLTVDDLRDRIARAPFELGTETSGLRVAGR